MGHFTSLGIIWALAAAGSVKTFFPELSRSGSRAKNKADALALTRKWGYSPDADHDADAIILCRYYCSLSSS